MATACFDFAASIPMKTVPTSATVRPPCAEERPACAGNPRVHYAHRRTGHPGPGSGHTVLRCPKRRSPRSSPTVCRPARHEPPHGGESGGQGRRYGEVQGEPRIEGSCPRGPQKDQAEGRKGLISVWPARLCRAGFDLASGGERATRMCPPRTPGTSEWPEVGISITHRRRALDDIAAHLGPGRRALPRGGRTRRDGSVDLVSLVHLVLAA